MAIVLINPNVVVQKNDPFTTGIVYMPIGLAYVAASLRAANIKVRVIDAFAEKPYQARTEGNFLLLGLHYEEVVKQISDGEIKAVFVYAINLTNHLSTIGLIKAIKKIFPHISLIVLENPHAVTAYSLPLVQEEFYSAGADYILSGEGDLNSVYIAKALINGDTDDLLKIEGLGFRNFYNPSLTKIMDLDSLPFPAWDMFPLENYWSLRFAHGPQTTKRYLPLLTSRGCPFACGFCVTPSTSGQKWRARSAKNVVDEMEFFSEQYNVKEFHIEDLNPTVSDLRIRSLCNDILKRNLQIIWKIAAGTKAETIKNEETIELMFKAGCRYISISPETGSPQLLRLMKKPFNLEHAIHLVKKMNAVGIRSQACFVLGYPGETDDDLRLTWNMVKNLTTAGVDEIALFINSPVPGSMIYEKMKGYSCLSELNFSPAWRSDYRKLNAFRLNLYKSFLLSNFLLVLLHILCCNHRTAHSVRTESRQNAPERSDKSRIPISNLAPIASASRVRRSCFSPPTICALLRDRLDRAAIRAP